MKIELKTLISIITAAVVLGGFYYTTQLRLDYMELQIEELEAEISRIRKIANKKNK